MWSGLYCCGASCEWWGGPSSESVESAYEVSPSLAPIGRSLENYLSSYPQSCFYLPLKKDLDCFTELRYTASVQLAPGFPPPP